MILSVGKTRMILGPKQFMLRLSDTSQNLRARTEFELERIWVDQSISKYQRGIKYRTYVSNIFEDAWKSSSIKEWLDGSGLERNQDYRVAMPDRYSNCLHRLGYVLTFNGNADQAILFKLACG